MPEVVYESDNFRVVQVSNKYIPQEQNDNDVYVALTTPDNEVIQCDTLGEAIAFELGA